MAQVVARIRRFNDGREPERLQMKYDRMAQDAFSFLRGTCHLFYEDWPRRSRLNDAPLAWICGDLHFENFGTYKGNNRLVYFDLNDFDESVLAPCTWDVTRFLTSLIVGARDYRLPHRTIRRLCSAFLDAYCFSLADGKPRWVERETTEGMVRALLRGVADRTQKDLLDKWATRKTGQWKIAPQRKRVLRASANDKAKARAVLEQLVRQDGYQGPLRMLDAARRVAGTGNLGLERYVVLVQGPSVTEGVGLLDVKVARPSSLEPYVTAPQPRWKTAAERIVAVQRRMQAVAPALLTEVQRAGASYVVRELQPVEDRIDLQRSKGKLRRLESVATTLGQAVAWAHLRGGAHQGASGPEDLMTFGGDNRWQRRALEYAEAYSVGVQRDWETFHDAKVTA